LTGVQVNGFDGDWKETQSGAKGSATALFPQRLSLRNRRIESGVGQIFINRQAISNSKQWYCTKTKQTLELNHFACPLRATTMAISGDRIGNSGEVTLGVPEDFCTR
jgi:hypothetical protein